MWALEAATGKLVATFKDLPLDPRHHAELYVGEDLAVARAGDVARSYRLRTAEPVADLAGCRFEDAHGAVFALRLATSPADGPAAAARLERLSATGAPAFSHEVEPAIDARLVWGSQKGVVATGPGGFVELSPTGEVLRSYTLSDRERAGLAPDGTFVQVHEDTVIVTLAKADATGKLLLFAGKRPREVPLAGLRGVAGVVPVNYSIAKVNPKDRETITLRQPLVAVRGKKRYVFVEVAPDAKPGLPGDAVGLHAVELGGGGGTGPRVTLAPRFLGEPGFGFQQLEGTVVDAVTGRVTAKPGGGGRVAVQMTDTFWYHVERGRLVYGALVGGEPKTVPLPHEGSTAYRCTFGVVPDMLCIGGGGRQDRAATEVVIGAIDLKTGRVDVLVRLPAEDFAQMADFDGGADAVYYAVLCERGKEKKQTYQVLRRDRRGR
jgi:hypothetical protein